MTNRYETCSYDDLASLLQYQGGWEGDYGTIYDQYLPYERLSNSELKLIIKRLLLEGNKFTKPKSPYKEASTYIEIIYKFCFRLKQSWFKTDWNYFLQDFSEEELKTVAQNFYENDCVLLPNDSWNETCGKFIETILSSIPIQAELLILLTEYSDIENIEETNDLSRLAAYQHYCKTDSDLKNFAQEKIAEFLSTSNYVHILECFHKKSKLSDGSEHHEFNSKICKFLTKEQKQVLSMQSFHYLLENRQSLNLRDYKTQHILEFLSLNVFKSYEDPGELSDEGKSLLLWFNKEYGGQNNFYNTMLSILSNTLSENEEYKNNSFFGGKEVIARSIKDVKAILNRYTDYGNNTIMPIDKIANILKLLTPKVYDAEGKRLLKRKGRHDNIHIMDLQIVNFINFCESLKSDDMYNVPLVSQKLDNSDFDAGGPSNAF